MVSKQMLCFKLLCVLLFSATALAKKNKGVTYDGRSLIINGRRELLFSGSIHYPRSTPEQWPELISKAKHGGINLIQTYVFWNVHEPVEGQFNFEGRNDLVKFLKIIHQQGLYVTLRLGPFIAAEWNYGGFPYWLREVPGIIFRTDNKPFKKYMKRYTKMIVNLMKEEKLFASQGGPIILAQIENEYNSIQSAYKENGAQYVQWAGTMAVGMKTGVPWVMCKQKDAPDPVINACNGRNCGDTFTGPNKPYKPALWTENWTAQYRVFGDPPSQRSAEDLAYSVARFFSKNGTLANYYMYHGGTNFGRTASALVTTRYYDEAPLDEYGLFKEPKYGHLKDLHAALRLCRKALLWGTPSVLSLGPAQEARVYEKPGTSICAAFLSNNLTREPATVTFRNVEYHLPRHSISILPDCKTVVFNTNRVNSQHNMRSHEISEEATKDAKWKVHREKVPTFDETSTRVGDVVEHLNMTKDTTDFLWYTTTFDVDFNELPTRRDIRPVIQVSSLGHGLHAFVNNIYIGTAHGNRIDKSFTFQKEIPLKSGVNQISLLSMTIGLPNSGVYLEHRLTGIHIVSIQGLSSGTHELSSYNQWGYKVGMDGEKLGIYKQPGIKKVQWKSATHAINQPLSWYKRHFDAPAGSDPVAIDLSSMSKGEAWVNGESIGRYWVSFLSPLGQPSQSFYHIPRSFLKPKNNLLVIFEEIGGNPHNISIVTVNRDTICSLITEYNPPNVKSWERKESEIRTVVDHELKPRAQLKCPNHKVIQTIEFASYGNATGICGSFNLGTCHAQETKDIVEKACLGKTSCVINLDSFANDPCPDDDAKTLAVQAKCMPKSGSNE